MGNNNKGRDFLFSDDYGFLSEDDGESYRYSDGSGYYRGKDGSEARIFSDGSGYYRGADGSEGHIFPDGSGYFHGSDGSSGTLFSDGSGHYDEADGGRGWKYEDGSGYYQKADGSRTNYDACTMDDESSDMEESDGEDEKQDSAASKIVELLFDLGAAAVAGTIAKSKEESRRQEAERREAQRIAEEQERVKEREKQKKKARRAKRVRAFILNKKQLTFPYPTDVLLGSEVGYVREKIESAGFNNCHSVPIKDIYPGVGKFVGEVEQVVVDGQSWIDSGTSVPYDAEIIITYHAKKDFAFPYSKRTMIGMGYKTLANELVDIGFTQIYVSRLEDLKTGFFKRENAVSDVVIDGIETIKSGMMLEYDREINIQYHAFPGR